MSAWSALAECRAHSLTRRGLPLLQIGEATRTHALLDGILGLLEGNRNAFFTCVLLRCQPWQWEPQRPHRPLVSVIDNNPHSVPPLCVCIAGFTLRRWSS